MVFLLNTIKKLSFALAIAVYIGAITISLTHAQNETNSSSSAPTGTPSCNDSISCLKAITQNTYGVLHDLNSYLWNLTKADGDTSSPTLAMQGNFTTLGNLVVQYINPQGLIDPVQLSLDIINSQPADDIKTFTKADYTGSNPKINDVLKPTSINDLSYSTIIGQPPAPDAKPVPYNYVKNITGMNVLHALPQNTWGGSQDNKNKYKAYYNTIMSVESFNAFVLNSQYLNKPSFTQTQTALINTATSGDQWFTQIAGEEIGKVLRQILMFDSQSYVLLAQIVELQKQILAAHIMTNTLIISGNTSNENYLVSKAKASSQT